MAMIQAEWWGDYVFQWKPTLATRDAFLRSPPVPVSEWGFRAWRLGDMAELTSEDVARLER